MRALLLLLAAAACSGGDDTAPAGGDDTAPADDTAGGGGSDGGAAGGSDGGGTGGGDTHDEVPVVLDGDVWCYRHETGDQRWIWVARATADDPQGVDTLDPIVSEGVTAYQGSTEIGSYAFSCSTSTGECSATFDDGGGLSCPGASSFTFLLVVEDEDGNRSEPYEVQGRQGSGPDG